MSRYGSTSTDNFRTKATRVRPRRQKDLEFFVNPTKWPTLTSSSSRESTEEASAKNKEKDIGIIEFSMSILIDSRGKIVNDKTPES